MDVLLVLLKRYLVWLEELRGCQYLKDEWMLFWMLTDRAVPVEGKSRTWFLIYISVRLHWREITENVNGDNLKGSQPVRTPRETAVHSILVTLSPAMGLRTASARHSASGDGIISSISRLWSRLVDLILLSTMSTCTRQYYLAGPGRPAQPLTCKTSVTWLVFLLSSLFSVLLLLLRRRTAAMTTRETTAPVPTNSVNTLSLIKSAMLLCCNEWG